MTPLKRDWLSNTGTILTVRYSSWTLCSSLAMLVSGVGCPSTSAKIMVELCYVCMKGSTSMLVWDVHAVSQAAEGLDPPSTPYFTFYSVRIVSDGS